MASASVRSKRSDPTPPPSKAVPIHLSSHPRERPVKLTGLARTNENGDGHKVRDRLCQIISQHKLDPELVRAYAVDFCGTNTLKEASREQVESFVEHLAELAAKDRDALLCQLNSYARPAQEVVA